MFKLIEFALHCFYSNQYNTCNEPIKSNCFTQNAIFKKHSGVHKVLRMRYYVLINVFSVIFFSFDIRFTLPITSIVIKQIYVYKNVNTFMRKSRR